MAGEKDSTEGDRSPLPNYPLFQDQIERFLFQQNSHRSTSSSLFKLVLLFPIEEELQFLPLSPLILLKVKSQLKLNELIIKLILLLSMKVSNQKGFAPTINSQS